MQKCPVMSAPWSPCWHESTMASIPEHDEDWFAQAQAPSKVKRKSSNEAFKVLVEDSLRLECESPCGDALAHVFEEAARNTGGRGGSEAAGLFWSATEDASDDAASDTASKRPGRQAASAGPCRLRSVPSMRVTLHNSLPDAPGTKGLMAVVTLSIDEDARPRLRFCQDAKKLASFVLDGKSIKASLVAAPCSHAPGASDPQGGVREDAAAWGGRPVAQQWLRLTCEERGGVHGDIYAYAAMGWRALLPHLYARSKD